MTNDNSILNSRNKPTQSIAFVNTASGGPIIVQIWKLNCNCRNTPCYIDGYGIWKSSIIEHDSQNGQKL